MTTAMTIYVSTDGNDANPGTLLDPVKSIGEALIRTREIPAGKRRIVVRGGSYYDVGLTLMKADSDLTIEAFEGETPILYGGIPVRNWESRDGFLVAAIEGAKDRGRDFRMLEVDGAARPRARLPEQGAFRHQNRFDVPWMSSLSGGWARKPTAKEMSVLRYDGRDLGEWLDVNNAELTIYHEWDESLVGLSGLDPAAETVALRNLPGHPPGAFADRNDHAREYAVWNVREGMTRPGQWYLDRTNEQLVYWPLPEEREREDRLHAVAPSRERILHMESGVSDVRIAGLVFACSAAPLVSGGFASGEASEAIFADGVSGIVFEQVTVRHTGGWAFRLEGDDIRVEECHIHHTGAGGVRYAGNGIVLSGNRVHDVGQVYQSAVAVMGHGIGNAIRHNDISDTPYSGIVDTGVGTDIGGNLFHNVMTFMKDGAAVYCSGSKRAVVSGNAIIADPGHKTRSYAYYLDELCEDCAVEGNLAFGAGLPMLSHMTRNCRYVNNVFIDAGEQKIAAANTFGLNFDRNVLVADSIAFYAPKGNPDGRSSAFDSYASMEAYSAADGIVSLKNNILYSRSGRVVFHEYVHYEVVREYELEAGDGNVFADPMIEDLTRGDIAYAPSSPAHALGIARLALRDAGCSGSLAELMQTYGGNER